MNKKTILASLVMGAAALTAAGIYATAPGIYDQDLAKPFNRRYFAHRGLHSKDKSIPENSLAAFDLASELGYGMELDVQLSKDWIPVIFHDDGLKRVTGLDKQVKELTLKELKALRLNETEETIPTFREVLDVVKGRAPLIVELKPTGGKARQSLCTQTLNMLLEYREKTGGDFCVESFDPGIVRWFKKNAPELYRGQLTMACESYDSKIPYIMRKAMSLCLFNFAGRPHFVAYDINHVPAVVKLTHRLGAANVGWTSHDPEDSPGADTIIFEFYKPPLTF